MSNFSAKRILVLAVLILLQTTFSIAQPILPDVLTISNDLSIDGNPGNVAVNVTVLNAGTDIYPGGPAGFYLSSDTLLDEDLDALIFKIDVPSIGYGDTTTIADTVDFCDPDVYESFPEFVKDGSLFYVLYKLDYANAISESNEGNNTDGFLLPLEMGCITAIKETHIENFSVFPNPGNGHVQVSFPRILSEGAIMKLQNMNSQEVLTFTLDNTVNGILDFSFLPAGIYLCSVFDQEVYYQAKLLIE
ncbi:MAG: T9SS type A sorting domain-containing protein [Chitinophagales bacterium]